MARFASEVVVLEWCVVDAGLERESIRTIVGTVEKCRGLGSGVDGAEWEELLREMRRVWCGHWVGWASVDEGGSMEYGGLDGGGRGKLAGRKEELMVGKIVVTERTGEGEDDLVSREVLAENVAVEYEKMRAEMRGEK